MIGGVVRQAPHVRCNRVVPGEQLAGLGDPGLREQARGVDEGIALEVLADLGTAAITDLGVAARMAEEANAPQVQKRGAARAAHVFGCRQSRVIGARDVRPLGAEIAQMWPIRPSFLHPIARRADADAEAVVLAAEQHRHPQPLVHVVLSGVQRSQGSRVVERSIAE